MRHQLNVEPRGLEQLTIYQKFYGIPTLFVEEDIWEDAAELRFLLGIQLHGREHLLPEDVLLGAKDTEPDFHAGAPNIKHGRVTRDLREQDRKVVRPRSRKNVYQ